MFVYNELVKEKVNKFINGENSTIFLYGPHQLSFKLFKITKEEENRFFIEEVMAKKRDF